MDLTANAPSRPVAVATSPTGRYDAFKCTLIARQRVALSDAQAAIRDGRSGCPEKDDAVKLQEKPCAS